MKKLFLVRHGKSDWSNPGLKDFNRPLKGRGVKNATSMSRMMKEKNMVPDFIITSPAKRALDTAKIFIENLDISPRKMVMNDSVYFASPDELVDIIRHQEDSINGLMVFGHNPGFTTLANLFLPEPLDNIPTAGLVYLEFEIDHWHQISRANVIDHYFEYPKNL